MTITSCLTAIESLQRRLSAVVADVGYRNKGCGACGKRGAHRSTATLEAGGDRHCG